jgi:nitrate/nitrite-specific signal transduction histidine kinase
MEVLQKFRITEQVKPGSLIFLLSTLFLIATVLAYRWISRQVISYPGLLILISVLIFYATAGTLIILLGRFKRTTASPIFSSRQYQQLKQKLIGIKELDEFNGILREVSHRFLPVVGATFVLYDKEAKQYELVDKWYLEEDSLPSSPPLLSVTRSTIDIIDQGPSLGFFLRETTSDPMRGSGQFKIFCLPRSCGTWQIALLFLFFPAQVSLSHTQVILLNDIAQEIALALERNQMRRLLSLHAAAKKAENERIARYLHDTLGHNIAYLHLKLDQLSGDELQDTLVIRSEIERMRDIAEQAYEQVRNSLSDLRGEPTPEFFSAIQDSAIAASIRSGFTLRIYRKGQPRTLPIQTQRHILYILREVLRNIEKHAGAQRVKIVILWKNDDLILSVKDDGVGFDVEAARKQSGHYGLKIIEECVLQINGCVAISSSAKRGAKITFRFPLKEQLSAIFFDANQTVNKA